MVDDEERQPLLLDYSQQPLAKSSWPVGLYVFALLWAFVTMRVYSAATTAYRNENLAQLRTQVPLLACAAIRLIWARCRREQGKGWTFYVVLLLLAPILWAVVSPVLAHLGLMLWGKPLIP
jgi:hypothetical protein